MRYYKHKINECDCGGVSAPMQTLNNTGGIGNSVPAQMAATTGAEMTDPKCIGSGDKFGFDNKEKKKKKKPIYKRHNKSKVNEGFGNVFDSSLVDYSEDFEKQDIWYKNTKPIIDFIEEHVSFSKNENSNEANKKNCYYIDSEYNVHINTDIRLMHIFTDIIDEWGEPLRILKPIYELPFNIVESNCSIIADKLGLKTLKGFPKIVKGEFNVSYNNLKSLEYGPEEVYSVYNAEHNKLKNLLGMPKKIHKSSDYGYTYNYNVLRLTSNPNLKSSEGLLDDIDYEIEYPKGFFIKNKEELGLHLSTEISDEDIEKIKNKLKPYYSSFNVNSLHTNINMKNKDGDDIKIVKSEAFDYYFGLRWHKAKSWSGCPCEAGRGKHWDVYDVINEFIKRNNKGIF